MERFLLGVGSHLSLRRLVAKRKALPVSEADAWLDQWSRIKDPVEKGRRWEAEIGSGSELPRVQTESIRVAGILAGNLQPVLERGIIPSRPLPQAATKPPRSAAKTKVSQSFLNLIFATERTIRRHLTASRARNDLVKAEQLGALLTGGFEGVRLNVMETRLIHGIFNLLGDLAKVTRDGNIEIGGFSELYTAMGLERKRTARGKMEYDGREVQQANKVLWGLAGKAQQVVSRKETTPPGSRHPKFDILVTKTPLIQVGYLDKDITGKKVRYVAATASRPRGSAIPYRIVIKPHPALVAEYQRYFRLLPRDPYQEIRRILPPGQYVQAHQLNFLSWLHRHRPGQQVIERNKRSLAEEIGLGHLVQGGRWKELSKVIASNYRLAKRLGYLKEYRQNVPNQSGGVKDVLTLNPAMVVHAGPRRRT